MEMEGGVGVSGASANFLSNENGDLRDEGDQIIQDVVDANLEYQEELLAVLGEIDLCLKKDEILLHQVNAILARLKATTFPSARRAAQSHVTPEYTFGMRPNYPYFSYTLHEKRQINFNIGKIASSAWTDAEIGKLRAAVQSYTQSTMISSLLDKYRTLASDGAGNKVEQHLPEIATDYDRILAIGENEALADTQLDWNEVAWRYLPHRQGIECMMKWQELEEETSWTEEESRNLDNILGARGDRDWKSISRELNHAHTPIDCFVRYRRSEAYFPERNARKNWTQYEDDLLTQLVNYMGKDWSRISKFLSFRTKGSCENRWNKRLDPSLKKGRWSELEDLRLLLAVEAYGENWGMVEKQLQGRTDVQCRERWCNVLSPSCNSSPWTNREDEKLLEICSRMGTRKWSSVSRELGNRTDNQCWRRWKYLVASLETSPLHSQLKSAAAAAPEDSGGEGGTETTTNQDIDGETPSKLGEEGQKRKANLESIRRATIVNQFCNLSFFLNSISVHSLQPQPQNQALKASENAEFARSYTNSDEAHRVFSQLTAHQLMMIFDIFYGTNIAAGIKQTLSQDILADISRCADTPQFHVMVKMFGDILRSLYPIKT